MSFIHRTISVGCAAAAITMGPTCIVLGIAASICPEKRTNPLEDPWLLISTPILLAYSSYILWKTE